MKNVELLYLLVAYGMGGQLVRANSDGSYLTASNTAAGKKSSRYIFFWGLLISGALFGILMYGWFIPYFAMSKAFSIIIAILIICQLMTGLIPARGKRLNSLHLGFAFSLAFCMLLVVTWFVATPAINGFVRILNVFLALGMFGLLLILNKISPNKYLKYQWIYFSLWHIAVLATVYLG